MRWISLLLTCGLSVSAWADRYWVDPVKAGGIADHDRESVEELIRIAVPESGRHTVAAKKEDADFVLAPSLMKLGDAFVLSLQKRDKSGQTVYGERMKAASFGEIDTVATRLTRAVITQSGVEGTADVTNVTTQEQTAGTRRYNATKQWVLGIGPGWTSNLGSSGGGFTSVIGILWGLDPDFSVNLSWTYNWGPRADDSTFSDFSLGGEYYFTRSKHSPFVGARMGYGNAHVNKDPCNSLFGGCKQDRASGWTGTATAGIKFFRTSNVNTAILGTYSYIFDRSSLGNPALGSIQFAVYF